MSKHTPGPWEARETGDVKISTGEVFMVPGMSAQEIRANARLIAAAPKMYEYVETRAILGDEDAIELLAEIEGDRS